MDFELAIQHRALVEEFRRRHHTGLLTLVFTDIVDSTGLKQGFGEREAATLFQDYRALIRSQRAQFSHTEEIETAGDSFLLVFATPSQAVEFALLLQTQLEGWSKARGIALQQRVGIHLGEVVIEEHAGPGKAKDLYGGQLDVCARVMSLAGANQILMTRAVFDNARRMLKGEAVPEVGPLKWLNHGPYQFRGLEEPIEVCEVRVGAGGPVTPPTNTEKAQRVAAEGELVLGWRPAIGQEVPGSEWVLEEKLGEGGFGEVWLAKHQKLKELRVFKFCFRADRVRSLKREVTLFRLLKERIGEHPNIVRLYDVFFDQPPFYLVEEYVPGKDLRSWCDAQGRIDNVPMATRLEIVAQVTEALQAAHDTGVIHRDVKPGNILIAERGTRNAELQGFGQSSSSTSSFSSLENPKSEIQNPKLIQAKLTDFGIGQVLSEEYLSGITRAGFTQTMMGPGSSSQTGTQMYMAPELFAGKPASIRSDIYSLGVVLYQLLVGDFTRPVATDWEEEISDPLLRDDLKHCFAGNPQERFAGAGQLAKNLRALPQRQQALGRQQAELVARERAAYRRGVIRTAGFSLLIIALVSILAIIALNQSHRAGAVARELRLNLYCADMKLAQTSLLENNLGRAVALVNKWFPKPGENDLRGFEWRYLWQHCRGDESYTLEGHEGMVTCAVFSPNQRWIATAGFDRTVKIWDTASKQLVTNLVGFANPISRSALAFSPDAKLLAVCDAKKVIVFSAEDWHRVRELEGGGGLITAPLVFSPDGSTLATPGIDEIRFWQTTTWQPSALNLQEYPDHFQFSADGRLLAVASYRGVEVWNLASQPKLKELHIDSGSDVSLAFSHRGDLLAMGNFEGGVKIWDLSTHREIIAFDTQQSYVLALAFSPDDKSLATTGTENSVAIWDRETGKCSAAFKGHKMETLAVEFSPDGQSLLTASKDGTAKLWSLQPRSTEQDLPEAVLPLGFSLDGNRLITVNSNGVFGYWDVATLKQVKSVSLPGDAEAVNRYSYALAPDADKVAFGVESNVVQLWSIGSRSLLCRITNQIQWPKSLVFSPDGSVIAATSDHGSIYACSLTAIATGREQVLPNPGHLEFPAFSPDSRLFAYGTSNYCVQLWDIKNGRLLDTLKGHTWNLYRCAFSPDGQQLASSSWNPDSRLWDIRNGKLRAVLYGHKTGVQGLVFAPDGKTVVTSSHGAEVKFWNTLTGVEVLTLSGPENQLALLLFSPDGNTLVQSGFERRIVRVTTVRSLKDIDAVGNQD